MAEPAEVLLATCAALPDGEREGRLLVEALAARGVRAAWAAWDDDAVDWSAADLVAVRSTWDYVERVEDFLRWARDVESATGLLNGATCFAWNVDKGYLVGLDAPVVPTAPLDDVADLPDALARWGEVVVKSRTGAGGRGVVVADRPDDPRLEGLLGGPWIVQPLVASIATLGETSVFVLDGRAVGQAVKVPGAGEIRVHPQYGGTTRAVDLHPAVAATALDALEAAARAVGRRPDYARVDLVRHEGRLVVSELELTEPGLYLDTHPGNAAAFADLVVGRLGA